MTTNTLQLYRNTVHQDNDNYIAIKPICELFNLNVENQTRFIKSHVYLNLESTKKSIQEGKHGGNNAIFLSKKGFIYWIFQLNVNIFKDDNLKENFLLFTANLLEYMYANTESRINTLKHKLNIQNEIVKTTEALSNNPDFKKLQDLQAENMRINKDIKAYDMHILQPQLFGNTE
jgi:hypothetical protein